MPPPSFFLCAPPRPQRLCGIFFLLFFFRPRSSKKTFALFRIHSHLSPIDARHSSLHNAPTLQTGNRSSPDNRPRHLKKISRQTHPVQTQSCAAKGVCVIVGENKAKQKPRVPSESILEKPLPNNLDAERSVLGAVILDNNALNAAIENLKPEDFFLDQHRRVFTQMIALGESQQAIDLVTLTEE